jgi:hypothetical protein
MNDVLKNPADLLNDPATREADAETVMDHFVNGTSLDPAVAERVHARAEEITAEVYRKFGELNVAVDLIREVRDEE